jgi:hypothetical protein
MYDANSSFSSSFTSGNALKIGKWALLALLAIIAVRMLMAQLHAARVLSLPRLIVARQST